MSYSCDISFKKMDAENILDFLSEFKQEAIAHRKEIAEENCLYSPLKTGCYAGYESADEIAEVEGWDKYYDMVDELTTWAKLYVFQHRFFYIKEFHLLGIYGVPKSLRPLFDKTVYFQNSCDQDYERKDWEGIEAFEEIYDKYQNMPEKKIKEKIVESRWDDEMNDGLSPEQLAYYRRSLAYDEIWSYCEDSLYNDKGATYFSLFGSYDLYEMEQFAIQVFDAYMRT